MSDRKFGPISPYLRDLAASAVLAFALTSAYLLSTVQDRAQEVALKTQYVSDDQTRL